MKNSAALPFNPRDRARAIDGPYAKSDDPFARLPICAAGQVDLVMQLKSAVIRLSQVLRVAVTAVPFAAGAWLLLYYFVLPSDRGDGGPGNPPDIAGGLALMVGCLTAGWSLALLAATVGTWRGRRAAAFALGALCSLQASLQLWLLVREGELWPWPILTSHTGIVIACASFAFAATFLLPPRPREPPLERTARAV